MHEFLVSAAAFMVLVGAMVVIHELGHFTVAKLCGVRVEAFSFGFGPRLFGFKYGETDYRICLLPLGGYVKMTGENPEQNLEAPGTVTEALADDPGAFTSPSPLAAGADRACRPGSQFPADPGPDDDLLRFLQRSSVSDRQEHYG